MSTMIASPRLRPRAPEWIGIVLLLAAVAFIIASAVRIGADPASTRPGTVSPSSVYPAGGRQDFQGGIEDRAPAERGDGVRGHPVRRG
jgi:hypothetical protein